MLFVCCEGEEWRSSSGGKKDYSVVCYPFLNINYTKCKFTLNAKETSTGIEGVTVLRMLITFFKKSHLKYQPL